MYNNQFNNQPNFTPNNGGFNNGGFDNNGGFNNNGFNNGGFNNGGFQPQKPMNWYGFLVYFALWAGALISFITAIMYFTGGVYAMQGGSAKLVYWAFPSMQFFDILYAIACLAGAALGVYTAIALLGYRRNGPDLLSMLYILNGGAGVLYNVLCLFAIASSGVNTGAILGSVVGGIVGTVVMVLLNKIYFDKRRHMFNR